MAKKMISIKLDEGFEKLLIELAKLNNRSQGQQVQHMIKQECELAGIKLEDK